MGTIMHDSSHATPLPWVEYRRLQRLMLTMIGGRSAFAAILRRKLGSTSPALPPSVSQDIAVSGGRVQFKVDGKEADERTLTWRHDERDDARSLSLLSPRGLALLGLSPGSRISYQTEGGRTEHLEVDRVSNAAIENADPSGSNLRRSRRAVGLDARPSYPPLPSATLAGASHG
jgi:regulator of nucleoside diphosphate kinase